MVDRPHYPPWEGGNYANGGIFGVKLMLLGESLYEWEPGKLTGDIQSALIGEVSRDEWRNRYYTKVFQVVTGKLRRHASPNDFRAFWDSIVFYNFVQLPAGTKPRCRPSEQAWVDSRLAFESVIDRHRPGAVLVLGKELWRRLVVLSLVAPAEAGFGRLTVSNKVLAAFVYHPSSGGFSWKKWAARAAELLERARAEQSAHSDNPAVNLVQSAQPTPVTHTPGWSGPPH